MISGRPQKIPDQRCGQVRHLRLAFPYHQDDPTIILKLSPCKFIALDIAGELGQPVGSVGRWLSSTQPAVMLMPETSVHEYDLSQPGKDKIWSAKKITTVQAESVP